MRISSPPVFAALPDVLGTGPNRCASGTGPGMGHIPRFVVIHDMIMARRSTEPSDERNRAPHG